jgi:hypothetical protein
MTIINSKEELLQYNDFISTEINLDPISPPLYNGNELSEYIKNWKYQLSTIKIPKIDTITSILKEMELDGQYSSHINWEWLVDNEELSDLYSIDENDEIKSIKWNINDKPIQLPTYNIDYKQKEEKFIEILALITSNIKEKNGTREWKNNLNAFEFKCNSLFTNELHTFNLFSPAHSWCSPNKRLYISGSINRRLFYKCIDGPTLELQDVFKMHLFLYTYYQWSKENLFYIPNQHKNINQFDDIETYSDMSFHGVFILKPYSSPSENIIILCKKLGISVLYFSELENINSDGTYTICNTLKELSTKMHNTGYMYSIKKLDTPVRFNGISCSVEYMKQYYETNIGFNTDICIHQKDCFTPNIQLYLNVLNKQVRTHSLETIMYSYMKTQDSGKYLAKHARSYDIHKSFENIFISTLFPFLLQSDIIHTVLFAIRNGLCYKQDIVYLRFYLLHNIYEGMIWNKNNKK